MSDMRDEDREAESGGLPGQEEWAIVNGLQPETQGNTPEEAELGEDGEGDLAPEDEPDPGEDDAE